MLIEFANKLFHLFESHPSILCAWFHGSRVKGTHRHDSDLDIAIATFDRKPLPLREQLALISEIENETLLEIHLGFVNSDNLVFATEVMGNGILCYTKNEEKRDLLIMNLMSQYVQYNMDRKVVIDAYTK